MKGFNWQNCTNPFIWESIRRRDTIGPGPGQVEMATETNVWHGESITHSVSCRRDTVWYGTYLFSSHFHYDDYCYCCTYIGSLLLIQETRLYYMGNPNPYFYHSPFHSPRCRGFVLVLPSFPRNVFSSRVVVS